jgi:hypothetical protein
VRVKSLSCVCKSHSCVSQWKSISACINHTRAFEFPKQTCNFHTFGGRIFFDKNSCRFVRVYLTHNISAHVNFRLLLVFEVLNIKLLEKITFLMVDLVFNHILIFG